MIKPINTKISISTMLVFIVLMLMWAFGVSPAYLSLGFAINSVYGFINWFDQIKEHE
jgi:hypothetical protein